MLLSDVYLRAFALTVPFARYTVSLNIHVVLFLLAVLELCEILSDHRDLSDRIPKAPPFPHTLWFLITFIFPCSKFQLQLHSILFNCLDCKMRAPQITVYINYIWIWGVKDTHYQYLVQFDNE